MPRPCSLDLRMRVLREVEAGASRREAAECVEVSASSAIKWMQRLNETGSIAAKPSGGSISPLEAHAAVLLGLTGGPVQSQTLGRKPLWGAGAYRQQSWLFPFEAGNMPAPIRTMLSGARSAMAYRKI